MIPFFFTGSITTMIGLWALYALAYYGIIRKMGAEKGYAIVPVAAEWRMSKVLFASMRSFYQPVLATGLFLAAAYYVGPRSFFRYIFWLAGIVVYSIYLARLNWRISKSFNMGLLFQILTVLFPFPCLLYLGFGKAQFTAPTFMIHQAPKWVRYILNATVFLISAAELGALVFVVGLLSIRENMPRPLVEYLIKDANEEMGNITEQGPVVRREDVMDTEAVQTASAERERDYFYPDHAGDKSVVVMEYVVDMTYMATAHQKLDTLFESEKRAIAKSPENYANISIAASDAYTFNGDSQIDLIDYLCILADMDYKNEIMTDAQYKELIDAIRACVVVRNANSATGVNGLAFCFPTKMISDYTPTYNQLTAMGLDAKKSMCNDYFSITLVGSDGLAKSGSGNNAWFAYVAALNILNRKILFSKTNLLVSKLFEVGTDGKRKSLEKHHLFPKAYLSANGYSDTRINQMANYAYIDWKDNMEILDEAPSKYYPIICQGRTQEEILQMEQENALPHGWENMTYEAFLEKRRKLMAEIIQQGFEVLKKNVESLPE